MNGHLLVSYHTCPMEEPGKELAGGMNVFLRGLLRGLGEGGAPTDVLTRAAGDALVVTAPFPGVRIFHIPCGWTVPATRRSAWESLDAFVERSRRLVREEGLSPDVVSAHYWMSGVAARRIADAPMVLVYHTVEARKAVSRDGEQDKALSGVRREAEERLAREAERVVCFTEYDLERNRRILPGLSGKAVVIPPGVDERFRRLPPREVARSYAGLPPTTGMVFLLAARGDAGKNARAAVEAFRSLPERWREESLLVIAGQEAETGRSSGRIVSLGPVPHDGMPVLFAAADAVLCPSLYESFGLVPLEALAGGVPVVVPGGTYWGEKIREAGGGVVYTPADPGGLSGAMLSLLSDPGRRAGLSSSGPAAVAEFTWERCTASWAGLLSSVSMPRNPR